MNDRMWGNPITKGNVQKFEQVYNPWIVGPAAVKLLSGDEGVGGLADLEVILDAVSSCLTQV